MRKIVLIGHNIRSCHNVGSLLRTAEGLGVERVYLTGYTPYPLTPNDSRLPHLANKLDARISKTALGAEKLINWEHSDNIEPVMAQLKDRGYRIVALEQTPESQPLNKFVAPDKVALVVGRETLGLEPEVLILAEDCLEIPMAGRKESFNVVQAAAIALYHFRFKVACGGKKV